MITTGAKVGVSHIHADRALPEMTVFELAVASAVSRRRVGDDAEVAELLSDWFQFPVRVPDAQLALSRLAGRGWVAPGATMADALLTEAGIDAVTVLYGGAIRMLDRGMGLLHVGTLLTLFDGFGKDRRQ